MIYINGIFRFFSFFLIFLLISSVFTSCKTSESSTYFQNLKKDTTIKKFTDLNGEVKIRKNDVLSILVTSLSTEASLPYNTPGYPVISSGTSISPSGYTVDKDGNIYLFKLGVVHAEGFTKFELKKILEKSLEPYLKDPNVVVRFLNQKVTIIGDITHPSVIPLLNEKISLFDALALSGEIPQTGKVDNILLIRDEDSTRIFKHINLKNNDIFNSPYYYLKPDDVVYVEPKKIQQTLSPNTAQLISIGLSTVSILIIILRGLK